jgi:hypothetical protein
MSDEVQEFAAFEEEEWGFSSAAPAAVNLVTEEEDWDFDSASPAAGTETSAADFRQVVAQAAEKWLGKDWSVQLLSQPSSTEASSSEPELSWKDEMNDSIRWEDTETYQRYQSTLKGMLGGHRAALLASVAKRQASAADPKEDESASVGVTAKPKRKERVHSTALTDEDRTNPFT